MPEPKRIGSLWTVEYTYQSGDVHPWRPNARMDVIAADLLTAGRAVLENCGRKDPVLVSVHKRSREDKVLVVES